MSPRPSPSTTPTGVPTPTPSSNPTSTPGPIAMTHVLTADYYGGTGDTTLSPGLLAPWVTWLETSFQANPAVRAAGIKAMYYTNPNREAPGDPLYTKDESTFAHTCSGQRIGPITYNQYLMDPASSDLRQLWKNFIASRITNTVQWDAIFEDDANDVVGAPALPCNYSAASWLAASQGENSYQAPYPIVYNGLQIPNEMGLNASSNVIGGMEEGCYGGSSRYPKMWGKYWTQIANVELGMAQQGKLFFCYDRDPSTAASALDGRLYTYASFLITYTPSSSILWETYSTPSSFHVEPESMLVALSPVVPQPSDVSALQVSSQVYGREYRACYIAGSYVGSCAAVVNIDRFNAHPYPYGTKYTHTLILTGGGILDGGTISAAGPPPPANLPALGSEIVFP
jgi:hypothetical protein